MSATKYAIVPVEPSEYMLEFAQGAMSQKNQSRPLAKRVYAAMLAASPPSDLVAVPRGLLGWVLSRGGDSLGIFHAGGSLKEPVDVWACHGCGAETEVRSSPKDAPPRNFPHEAGCKYREIRALLSTTATGEVSSPKATGD